jgi:hypothetical protein
MRANGNASIPGESNSGPHHRRIPGMKATRDVCRRHASHDLGIVAQAIRTKGLADVAVEIDGGSHTVHIVAQTAQLVELATANWSRESATAAPERSRIRNCDRRHILVRGAGARWPRSAENSIKTAGKPPGTGRHTTCSMPGCRRPEYLRQGAVSCWGAGSPANTRGIVNKGDAPFFLYRARPWRVNPAPATQTAAPSGYCSASRSSFARISTVVPERFHAPSVSNLRSPMRRPHGAMTRPIAR